jgi:hypothetical protein
MAFSGFNGPMPAGVQRQFKEIFKTWKGYGWEWFSVRPSPRVAAKSGRRRSRAYPSQNLRRSESLGLSRARRSGRPRGPHLIRTPASPSNASTPTMRSTTATGSSATSRATSPQSCRTHSDGPSRQLPASSPDEPGRPLDRPPTSHSEPAFSNVVPPRTATATQWHDDEERAEVLARIEARRQRPQAV